ncbi:MAG: glycosyltransferase [Acidobacteria bacterium]|nr:MAG: glycosyltransferase [Acidobacteriota bacterium]
MRPAGAPLPGDGPSGAGSGPTEAGADDESRLRVVFVLAGVELFGGVKVVLQLADLLRGRGHRVVVAAPAPAPSWYSLGADYLELPALEAEHLPAADLYVGTFYTTLAPARDAASARGATAVHLCQGFEGALSHNRGEHPLIDQAYRLPLPALTVSEHLTRLIEERFRRPARRIRQPVDPAFRPLLPRRERPTSPARILITGAWEFYLKGVDVALAAVRRLRREGLECQVVRLSQWPLCDAERKLEPSSEFHHHLRPSEVPELLRGCDLLLAPSWPVEGFGLPVLEAFASGVPVVASDIPSFREFAAPAAALLPHDDEAGFAREAARLLRDPQHWRSRRDAGLAVAADYGPDAAAEALVAGLRWARSTTTRRDPAPVGD